MLLDSPREDFSDLAYLLDEARGFYSPTFVVGEFCELRIYGVLGSSL
jgi:hypothetical protein